MSKIKLIRCKTPHDIIVVRNRHDRELIYELARSEPSCGHNHLIVSGDLYFRTPGYAKAEITDIAQQGK